MQKAKNDEVMMVKRILRTPKTLVTIDGYPATCPFQINKRCMTSCALCTEVVIDVIDKNRDAHIVRTGEWQCSLAKDGNTLAIEEEWVNGAYNPIEIIEDDIDYLNGNTEDAVIEEEESENVLQ